MSLRRLAFIAILGLLASSAAWAGLTRHDVLVVYNSNSAASRAVANYYAVKRGIPASHVRSVACSTGDLMYPSEFSTVRDAIKAHLVSLGADAAHPESDPIKAIVLCYGIPYTVSDYGEAYGAADSGLCATFTDSPWGKEPIGIYGDFQPAPGAPNPYFGDYTSPASFPQFRSNVNSSTFYETFPAPGFEVVRLLDANTALAAGGGGVLFRGTRSGSTWTWNPIRGSSKGAIGWRVSSISVLNSTHAFACTGNASKPHGGGTIIYSSDGGQTWTRLRSSVRGTGWKLKDALLSIDFGDLTHGWAVGTSELYNQSATPLLLSTTNRTTWSDTSANLPASFYPRAVTAADANNVWICGAGGLIYHSGDGGATWSLANTGAPSATYAQIWIRYSNGAYRGWAAGTGGKVIRTEDGTNWSVATSPTTSDITDLSVFDQDHACAAYNSTTYLKYTGGIGWATETNSLAPVVSAAWAGSGSDIAVGETRYIFAKPSSWAASFTCADTPWRLRYLVTRLDGLSDDVNPVDGIPDDVKSIIDRASAATAGGKFIIDERTLTDTGQTVTANYFIDTYNALLPIVGSSGMTYDTTSTFLTHQSNVIGYVSQALHDGYADTYTTWGRPFNTWANGGIAMAQESTDGRSFHRGGYYAWSMYAGGTKTANTLTVYGFRTASIYSGYKIVLCDSAANQLASATISGGQASINLTMVAWPADHRTYVQIRFPSSDALHPGETLYDAWYPNKTSDTTVYDNRTTGFALTVSLARSLMADMLREGATGCIANVDEPWSNYTGHSEYIMPRYAEGYTWAESAYMGLAGLGWQEVAVGDPLMAPFATPPTVQITSPASDGSLTTNTVHVTASATPPAGGTIQRVEFWLDDDTLLTTLYSAPYQVDINTIARGMADGVHSIEAVAYKSGTPQNTASAIRYFVVNNTHPLYPDIPSATNQNNSQPVALQGKTVSAAYNGFFYIQETALPRGIRVVSAVPVTEGRQVTVLGTLRKTEGEREILADAVWAP